MYCVISPAASIHSSGNQRAEMGVDPFTVNHRDLLAVFLVCLSHSFGLYWSISFSFQGRNTFSRVYSNGSTKMDVESAPLDSLGQ